MKQGASSEALFVLPMEASELTKLYISFEQDGQIALEKSLGADGGQFSVQGRHVTLSLTQEDTLGFVPGDLFIELTGERAGKQWKSALITARVERAVRRRAI